MCSCSFLTAYKRETERRLGRKGATISLNRELPGDKEHAWNCHRLPSPSKSTVPYPFECILGASKGESIDDIRYYWGAPWVSLGVNSL